MTSFTAKTLFVCFDFVVATVFTLSTTRTTTAAATEFTQAAAMAAPYNFLIHNKLTSLQASYTLATLCDWCVVSYCCRLLCELRYRCVEPTVLCYGRESSTCCIWIYPDEKRPAAVDNHQCIRLLHVKQNTSVQNLGCRWCIPSSAPPAECTRQPFEERKTVRLPGC